MAIEVTSVSRKPERRSEAAAAVAVVTREEIAGSGVSSIPEALRLVPGVEVASVDANKWAISIRGFNSIFANKLLVLVDGRSRYNTMYSGVLWETVDMPMADVERIEVVRGPGATMWGANAVNGVINVITSKAVDTPGTLIQVGAGTADRRAITVRQAGPLGEELQYRVSVHHFDRAPLARPSGGAAADAWQVLRGGFGLEWQPGPKDAVCLQTEAYSGDLGETLDLAFPEPPHARIVNVDADFSGGHLLGRWEHAASPNSEFQAQFYYDRAWRRDLPLLVGHYDNLDVDFQHRLRGASRHEVVWGLGYRLTWDDLSSQFNMVFHPPQRRYHLISAFAQGDLSVVPERLRVTLGSKFEHNGFSGFEVQPGARLLWTPSARQAGWAAVSRAVRIPSRADHDIGFVREVLPAGALGPGTPPAFVYPTGTRSFDPESMLSFEVGYRLRPLDRLMLDLATFCSEYDRLRTYEAGLPYLEADPAPLHLVLPLYQRNLMRGTTRGAELAADWQVHAAWRLRGGYSYLGMSLRAEGTSLSASAAEAQEDEDPTHHLFITSTADLGHAVRVTADLRHVSRLQTTQVPGYWEGDARLAWRLLDQAEVAVQGRNLLHDRHPEYRSVGLPFVASEVGRSVQATLTLSM